MNQKDEQKQEASCLCGVHPAGKNMGEKVWGVRNAAPNRHPESKADANWQNVMIYLKFNPWEEYTVSDGLPTEDTERTSIFLMENSSLEMFWAFITMKRTVMIQPTLTHSWQSWWTHSAPVFILFCFQGEPTWNCIFNECSLFGWSEACVFPFDSATGLPPKNSQSRSEWKSNICLPKHWLFHLNPAELPPPNQ